MCSMSQCVYVCISVCWVCVCVAVNSHACYICIVNDITDFNTSLFSVSGFFFSFSICKEVCIYICVCVSVCV